jgi:hypothetical protein
MKKINLKNNLSSLNEFRIIEKLNKKYIKKLGRKGE